MIKSKGFDIIISSDNEYEELCAEIYFDGEFVAIISQEQGNENPIIEISPQKNTSPWTFDFFEFLEIFKKAQTEI